MQFSPDSKSLLAWWHLERTNCDSFLTLICINKASAAVHVVSNTGC